MAGALPLQAQQVLDFEGPTVCPPSGYTALGSSGGLNWSNFQVANRGSFTGTGADHGFGDCIGFNRGGNMATMQNANPFVLNGGYFTSGWAQTLTVTVEGWRSGGMLWSESFDVTKNGNTQWFAQDTRPVDAVTFLGSNPIGDSRTHIVMDDLDLEVAVTPEPATLGLLATGLLGVGLMAWRKKDEDAGA